MAGQFPKLRGVRILDKYLLREFVVPVVYCFDGFALLWVVQDLLNNLPEFIQAHATLGQVLRYYLIVFPEAFVLITPVTLLLGLLFCLANLGKHNELVAMRASGVSLTRLAVPLLAIGLVTSLAVFVVNELFVAHSKERADDFMRALRGQPRQTAVENFFYTNIAERRDWYVHRFNPTTTEMETVEVHEETPANTPRLDIYADRAKWVDGQWLFYDASIHDYQQQPPVVSRVTQTNFPSITDRPRHLALEARANDPNQMTSAELRRYLRMQMRMGRLTRVPECSVALHYRYAFPFTSLMVVWLGLPLGLRVSRSGAFMSVGISLLLVVAFYFTTSIMLRIGEGGHLPAVVAAWFTHTLFAVIGGVLLVRVR